MDRYTRWAALLDLLARDGRLTVEEVADKLAVSAATVRRDFDALAKQRKLVRLRGAALHHAAPAATNLIDTAMPVVPAAARRIAAGVAVLVRPATVVGLAGGGLAGPIARALAVRFDSAGSAQGLAVQRPAPAGLTLVTNDLAIAGVAARHPSLKVVCTGGVVDAHSMTLAGPLAGLLLQGVSLDTVVIAADAVDPEFGVTAADEFAADSCALMVERCRQVVVAARSVDLNRTAFACICGTERIDVLVTDPGIAPTTEERFAQRGVRVVTA